MIKKPAAISSVLPAGCKLHTPSYNLAICLGVKSTVHEVSEAAKQWYDMAESSGSTFQALVKKSLWHTEAGRTAPAL